jgi:hypothetical protein
MRKRKLSSDDGRIVSTSTAAPYWTGLARRSASGTTVSGIPYGRGVENGDPSGSLGE